MEIDDDNKRKQQEEKKGKSSAFGAIVFFGFLGIVYFFQVLEFLDLALKVGFDQARKTNPPAFGMFVLLLMLGLGFGFFYIVGRIDKSGNEELAKSISIIALVLALVFLYSKCSFNAGYTENEPIANVNRSSLVS